MSTMTSMAFLSDLISKLFGTLLSTILGAWKQERLEQKASQAEAAIKRVASAEAAHQAEDAMSKRLKDMEKAIADEDLDALIKAYNRGG